MFLSFLILRLFTYAAPSQFQCILPLPVSVSLFLVSLLSFYQSPYSPPPLHSQLSLTRSPYPHSLPQRIYWQKCSKRWSGDKHSLHRHDPDVHYGGECWSASRFVGGTTFLESQGPCSLRGWGGVTCTLWHSFMFVWENCLFKFKTNNKYSKLCLYTPCLVLSAAGLRHELQCESVHGTTTEVTSAKQHRSRWAAETFTQTIMIIISWDYE